MHRPCHMQCRWCAARMETIPPLSQTRARCVCRAGTSTHSIPNIGFGTDDVPGDFKGAGHAPKTRLPRGRRRKGNKPCDRPAPLCNGDFVALFNLCKQLGKTGWRVQGCYGGVFLLGKWHPTLLRLSKSKLLRCCLAYNSYALFGSSSKIRMAAAMVVVHRPFLSPTALCVTFAVRTILLEMR